MTVKSLTQVMYQAHDGILVTLLLHADQIDLERSAQRV